jgi:hypothetical protein
MSVSGRATFPLFISEETLEDSVSDARSQLLSDLVTLNRLLSFRTRLRTIVAQANAEHGISRLLAEKAGLEDEISVLEAMPGVARRQPEREENDAFGLRRRRNKTYSQLRPLDMVSLKSQIEASRNRFSAVSGEDSVVLEVETSLLTPADINEQRAKVAVLRRNLDRVVEELRSINARTSIEVDGREIEWLESIQVI